MYARFFNLAGQAFIAYDAQLSRELNRFFEKKTKNKKTANNLDLTTSMTHRGIILGISFSFGLFSIVLTDGLFSTVEKKN